MSLKIYSFVSVHVNMAAINDSYNIVGACPVFMKASANQFKYFIICITTRFAELLDTLNLSDISHILFWLAKYTINIIPFKKEYSHVPFNHYPITFFECDIITCRIAVVAL